MHFSEVTSPHYIQRLPIPFTIAVVLYTKTCLTLWRVDKVAHATSNVGRSVVQQRQAKELGKRKRAVKMMIVCVVLFFLCYAPMSFIELVSVARSEFNKKSTFLIRIPSIVYMANTLVLLLCSSINPIVYAVYSSKFREQLRKVWQFVASFRLSTISGQPTVLTGVSVRPATERNPVA